jgi:hypothetical protein
MQVPTQGGFHGSLWRDVALRLSIVTIERKACQGLEGVVSPWLFGYLTFG